MSKKMLLVLCTGNSCRSHMAEGMVNHYLGDDWIAFSAGTEPVGYVHPLAVAVLAELGIDISDHKSKPTDEFRNMPLNWVITVCDDAAENCPLWLGKGNTIHLPFPDPARVIGSEDKKMEAFRDVRDNMREQLLQLLAAVS